MGPSKMPIMGPPKMPIMDPRREDGPPKMPMKQDADNGPSMSTPSEQTFGPLPHWITSTKASSGYKGVDHNKARGGCWRVKTDGNTIGRYDSVGQAAEAYYRYTKTQKPKKKKQRKYKQLGKGARLL